MYSSLRKFAAGVSATAVTLSSVVTMGVATAQTSFTDAGQISSWAADAVTKLVDAGVLAGTPDGSFNPAGNLNRAEMAKVAVLGAGLSIDTTGAPHFADVQPSDWFYPYVETLYNYGVVGGINNGALDENGLATYNPAGTLNRAEAAKILNEAYDMETSYAGTPPNFPDVASSAWFFDYVETAYAHGMLSGYADGRFGPADNMTREQVAVVAQNGREEAGLVAGVDAGSKKRTGYTAGAASTVVAETPTTPGTPATSDGTLSVSLASSSPSAATLPASAIVKVAAWDMTASSAGDVTVTTVTVKRGGIGNREEIDALVLKDGQGSRISKSKTGVNSDDVVTFSLLGGGMRIPAGTTKTVALFVQTDDATDGAGDSDVAPVGNHNFSIESASAVATNAQSVSGSFPIVSATHKINATDAGSVQIDEDGSIANVKVGNTNTPVAKFKLTASSTEDVKVQAITLKETGTADEDVALANIKLMNDGQTVATGTLGDKYINFQFSTPVTIAKGQNEKFEVRADIIGEPNKTLILDLDSTIDIEAVGQTYGFGVAIVDSHTAQSTTIEAGAVALTKVEPATEFREDKDNIVLGGVTITINAGQALELDDFSASLNVAGLIGGAAFNDIADGFENIELFDVKTGSSYDLSCTVADPSVCTDTDMGIALADGETRTFQVRADSKDVASYGTGSDAPTVQMSLTGMGTSSGGLVIRETVDDILVADVAPSSLTYKQMTGVASSVTVTRVVQSTTLNAVAGSSNIEGFVFEIEAGEAAAVVLDEVVLGSAVTNNAPDSGTNGGAATLSSTYISQLRLYEGTSTTPLDTVSGSQIAAGAVTFDGFNVNIAANQTKRFRVTYDVVNDSTLDNDTVVLSLTGLSIDDEDGDDVSVAAQLPLTATRTVTVQGSGSLTATVDNTDSATDHTKYVLGGGNEIVASYELTALNEGVQINDVSFYNTATRKITVAFTLDTTSDGTTGDPAAADLTLTGAATTVSVNAAAGEDASDLASTIATALNGTADVYAYAEDAVVYYTVTTTGFTGVDTAALAAALSANADDTVTLTDAAAVNLQSSISEVVLLDSNKTTEIARKTVTGNTVTFNDINHVVTEGTKNIYVQVVAHQMGRSLAGDINYNYALAMDVTDAEGDASSVDVTVSETSPSRAFATVPTQISAVAFVSSQGGVTVDSQLVSGAANEIAILQITTDASTNTDETDGSSLKTDLTALNFTVTSNTDILVNSITVERIGGTGDKTFATTHTAFTGVTANPDETQTHAVTVTLGSADTVNSQIDNGTSAYFVVKATPTLGTSGSFSAQVKLSDLNNQDGSGDANIEYDTDDDDGLESGKADRQELRLDETSIDGPIVSANL